MNEVIKNILTRRSVRKFIPEQIKEEELNLILDAAKAAPSGMNAQSWHFTVIQNRQKLAKLNSLIVDAAFQSEDQSRSGKLNYFYDAPTVIIVSNELQDSSTSTPESDSAAALQNIFLAAHSLGIGSCWVHILSYISESKELKDYLHELGVPKKYRVYGTAILGYPDGEVKSDIPRKEGTVNIVK